MPGLGSDELLSAYDEAPLNVRYWTSFAVLTVGIALDYFDFFIVGFLIAVLGPQWHLTYGQSGTILLAAGIGGIVGALVGGSLGDRFGRKSILIASSFTCAVGGGALAFVPAGNWLLFALFRFIVGFGLGGTVTPFNTLLVETTPTRYRTLMASLGVVFVTVGGLISALTSATLLAALGWRGVAALGVAPAIIGVLAIFLMPESARWLIARGRFAEARRTVANMRGVPESTLPLPTSVPAASPKVPLAELYRRPGLFWLTIVAWIGISTAEYAIILWGPTIFSMLLKISVREAAEYMVYLTLFGVIGKTAFSFIANWIGRRACGMLNGYAAAVALVAAAYFHSVVLAGFPIFVLLVMVAFLFVDGSFVNLAPYSIEAYGVKYGSRAAGLGQAANSVGRIVGPLCLAVIAGTGNLLSPVATEAAVTPTFLFLAVCALAMALVFTFLAPETSGIPLSQGDEPSASGSGQYDLAKPSVA